MPIQNVIIAGSPKTGTTSVFRYLAAHPEVCASSIKEIHFFNNFLNKNNQKTIKDYQIYFKHFNGTNKIQLEASPLYLQGGIPIAEVIHTHLPESKLVFIIREPVERFISRYISLITKTNRIGRAYTDLDTLVDKATNHPNATPTPDNPISDEEIVKYLWQGCYADFIHKYIDIHGSEKICLLFFDELKNEPVNFMKKFCNYIGIDNRFYENFQFKIENKTRIVKFRSIHKVAEKTNRKLEFIQNKFPALRQLIKSFYYSTLNPESKMKEVVVTDYAKSKLVEYYASHNERLNTLLATHYPDQSKPAWLTLLRQHSVK